jgi:hypothetical protein
MKIKQKIQNLKQKYYQMMADLTIEQLKAADDMNINQLWDFWFSYGVSLDFNATEQNIYLT